MKLSRIFCLLGMLFLISGCETLDDLNPFSDDDQPKLPGERVGVLQLDQKIQPDPALQDTPVTVPSLTTDSDWQQPGGSVTHVGANLSFSGNVNQIWSTSIGSGSSSGVKLLVQPVIAGGVVYTLDTTARLTATKIDNGAEIWQQTISPEDAREETLGGGISFGEGRLFASAGYPEVLAIDPATGKTIWSRNTGAPTRAAPTYANGRVFVLTLDNQLLALNAQTGEVEWKHNGTPENEAFLSDAGTAADNTIVIAPYSSGEIYALRVETGRVAWSDNLSAVRRASALWSLTDFNGLPVIDNGRVFAVSVSGRIVAIDERTGTRIWQHEIGSSSTPWVAGDYLYMVSADNQLLAIDAAKGGIRWSHQLDRYQNAEKRRDPIFWTAPVMVNGTLMLANSAGKLVQFSVQDGSQKAEFELPDPVFVQPVVVDNTIYILTDAGDLLAYR
jgi:outer membrane protein assembly factor BamB